MFGSICIPLLQHHGVHKHLQLPFLYDVTTPCLCRIMTLGVFVRLLRVDLAPRDLSLKADLMGVNQATSLSQIVLPSPWGGTKRPVGGGAPWSLIAQDFTNVPY